MAQLDPNELSGGATDDYYSKYQVRTESRVATALYNATALLVLQLYECYCSVSATALRMLVLWDWYCHVSSLPVNSVAL